MASGLTIPLLDDLLPVDSKSAKVLPQPICIVAARLSRARCVEQLSASFGHRSRIAANLHYLGELPPVE
jgi:hypothetical protein